MTTKSASLRDDVNLQPHQQHLADEAGDSPLRKLLYHGLGSGKTLSSIAAAEAHGQPYTAIVPAALRPNYQKEQQRFTGGDLPSQVVSYSQIARGKPLQYLRSLVMDEAQRLRSPSAKSSTRAQQLADAADQVLLLSGTPLTNRPGDLAVPLSMLTGQKTTPDEFERRFLQTRKVAPGLLDRLRGITPGEVVEPTNIDELKSMLAGHVDYYAPEKSVVPVSREDVHVDMSPEQTRLYRAMWDQLPWHVRWKLRQDFPLSREELSRLRSFLAGPRQVSLSTYPYLRKKDPLRAFGQSTKLQKAFELLQGHLEDPRTRALVFSNFIDAGLVPYAAAMAKHKIPHAVFHGGLNDVARKKLVDDYNTGKLRVALLGPSGMEGLSFKGTGLVQQLDPAWQPVRPRQAEGRALRFDSHTDLPEELRNVKVQRFISRLPPGAARRLLSRMGLWRSESEPASDEHLMAISARKDRLNQSFLDVLKEVGTRQQSVS
jgi:hypothetical protein